MGELCFLITYHPVTLTKQSPSKSIKQLLDALDQFPDAKLIFTKPNSDAGGRQIIELLELYVSRNPNRAALFTSLGQLRYLSALQHVDAVIGNSSSGIVEAPAFKKPTINIGDRQRGRLLANSIISCSEDTNDIVQAIHKALSPQFQENLPKVISLYGQGNTSIEIKNLLKTVDISNITLKSFHDVKFVEDLS
ncbi:UDP-N-acetylglucosamine 2-epimerase [Paenibacillus sp. JMULE4]|uniref:UDP-N-acetylglucosamine 2-epimerase n=1 Tax=Paenibacillus sp. JMULE4 TaxID=2518342 RepID=UPI0028149EF8|nr:UDP-N-acetylglucosamine 2-epimerase [Paenibacillus sp. JMULE4]